MSKTFPLIFSLLVGCQVAPPMERTEDHGLVLNITGTAPGRLSCVLENETNFTWHFMGYSDRPSHLVEYWDGTEWRYPYEFRCGTGVTIQSIGPGEEWEFSTRAEFSQPRVGISSWTRFSGRQDAIRILGHPPDMKTNTHPFVEVGPVPWEIDEKLMAEIRESLRERDSQKKSEKLPID